MLGAARTSTMQANTERLWQAVRLGEDSGLELTEVQLRGKRVSAPARDNLADEIAAFANARGGRLVLGVKDDRTPQSLEPASLDALMDMVSAICEDSIRPRLDYEAHRVAVPGGNGGVLVVNVSPGDTVHRSPGGYYRRFGDTKRQMQAEEIRRLLQARGQSDAAATDSQTVANTGVNTLHPELWRRYASSRTNESAEVTLGKLKFAKADRSGALRATVGGVLLACEEPREWLPNAYIQAVCYDSERMDGNRQLDAQDISGPLDRQIRDAMRFVARNRRVAARKDPGRSDVPQYSDRAVFEAIVNAVVHRDYAVAGAHIRLFLFDDRLQLHSPGGLCNSMTTADLRISQFTRNELLASRLGQCPVGDIAGAGERQYFIERRGEGIVVIEDETVALTGRRPAFEMIGERELKLTLPAASPPLPEGIAVRVSVRNDHTGEPLRDAHVLMLYPNKTLPRTAHRRFRPRGFLAAHAPAHDGDVRRAWICCRRGSRPLAERCARCPPRAAAGGGSTIIADGTGHLPGIEGRLNPILDRLDRTYLYAANIAVNNGAQQPVHFALNEPLRVTDSLGATATLWFREIMGGSCVFDYRLER